MQMDRKNNALRVAIVCIYILLGWTIVIPLIATACIYRAVFGGRSRELSKILSPSDYPDLQAQDVRFYHDNLAGTFYTLRGNTDPRAVVIVGHGIGCSRNGYLNRSAYFARKGYVVFAFDMTGTADSKGKSLVGLVQSQIDMERAIEYVQTSEYRNLPLLIYGHSWSGYGSATMLNRAPKGITAVVTLSGFDNSWDIMAMQGYRYAGKLILCIRPWMYLYQWMRFGKRAFYTGMGGVNAFDGPVLVSHSKDDPTVPFSISVAARQSECTNPQAEFLIFDDRGHTMSRSIAAEKQINADAKGKWYDTPRGKDNLFRYNVEIHYAWSDVKTVYDTDEAFMDQVDAFYRRVLDAKKQAC